MTGSWRGKPVDLVPWQLTPDHYEGHPTEIPVVALHKYLAVHILLGQDLGVCHDELVPLLGLQIKGKEGPSLLSIVFRLRVKSFRLTFSPSTVWKVLTRAEMFLMAALRDCLVLSRELTRAELTRFLGMLNMILSDFFLDLVATTKSLS